MPFLFIGIILIISGIVFRRMAHHDHDHGGSVGAEHLIYAGVILILFYGLLYRGLTLYF